MDRKRVAATLGGLRARAADAVCAVEQIAWLYELLFVRAPTEVLMPLCVAVGIDPVLFASPLGAAPALDAGSAPWRLGGGGGGGEVDWRAGGLCLPPGAAVGHDGAVANHASPELAEYLAATRRAAGHAQRPATEVLASLRAQTGRPGSYQELLSRHGGRDAVVDDVAAEEGSAFVRLMTAAPRFVYIRRVDDENAENDGVDVTVDD